MTMLCVLDALECLWGEESFKECQRCSLLDFINNCRQLCYCVVHVRVCVLQ